jgi:dipeptidyl aminopeptidase/acylaminoacyl peptidase
MSYGGYSALHALGRSPELYRCGISFAGPTDWHAMYRQSDVADYKQATRHWREQIGDPSKDEAMLKAISPVYFADKITAPVLIIQGKKDQRVPQVQARIMVEALEKAGRKPQTLFLSGVGHNYGQPKDREEIYNATVEFLEKHLGPGVP